jgi:hypothetical protein
MAGQKRIIPKPFSAAMRRYQEANPAAIDRIIKTMFAKAERGEPAGYRGLRRRNPSAAQPS